MNLNRKPKFRYSMNQPYGLDNRKTCTYARGYGRIIDLLILFSDINTCAIKWHRIIQTVSARRHVNKFVIPLINQCSVNSDGMIFQHSYLKRQQSFVDRKKNLVNFLEILSSSNEILLWMTGNIFFPSLLVPEANNYGVFFNF